MLLTPQELEIRIVALQASTNTRQQSGQHAALGKKDPELLSGRKTGVPNAKEAVVSRRSTSFVPAALLP